MKTAEVRFDYKKIEDYVLNRLNANDAADFEAEIIMDTDLQKEVARVILKKMIIERKVREQIERVEKERKQQLFLENKYVSKKKNNFAGVKIWWQRLTQNLVSI